VDMKSRELQRPLPGSVLVYKALLLLGLLCFAMTQVSADCDCVACMDSANPSAGGSENISPTTSCSSGQVMAVSLDVKSTDGSGLDVYTKSSSDSTQYYTGLSATDVSCVTRSGKTDVQYIIVQITCKNSWESCPVVYDIDFTCHDDGYSTSAPIYWPAPTGAPTPPNTPTRYTYSPRRSPPSGGNTPSGQSSCPSSGTCSCGYNFDFVGCGTSTADCEYKYPACSNSVMWSQTTTPAGTGLSTGVIVGIVVGSLVGVGLFGGVAVFLIMGRRKQHAVSTNAPVFQ